MAAGDDDAKEDAEAVALLSLERILPDTGAGAGCSGCCDDDGSSRLVLMTARRAVRVPNMMDSGGRCLNK